MRKFAIPFAFIVTFETIVIGNSFFGCSAAQNHVIAQDALTASQILCVLASNFTDDAAVAQACAIDKALVPLVRPFLLQNEARSVRQCSDAGVDAR